MDLELVRRRFERRVFVGILVMTIWIAVLLFSFDCDAAGPWNGQVVDLETKKPIEGAVVLMVWYKERCLMDCIQEYHDSEEVVTDAEGRFTISSRWYWSWFVFTGRPEIYILKGGYGKWQIRDYGKYTREKYGSDTEQNAARLTGEVAVLELPQLQNRQQRMEFQRSLPPLRVPDDRMRRFLDAYNGERKALGLDPIHVLPK